MAAGVLLMLMMPTVPFPGSFTSAAKQIKGVGLLKNQHGRGEGFVSTALNIERLGKGMRVETVIKVRRVVLLYVACM